MKFNFIKNLITPKNKCLDLQKIDNSNIVIDEKETVENKSSLFYREIDLHTIKKREKVIKSGFPDWKESVFLCLSFQLQ